MFLTHLPVLLSSFKDTLFEPFFYEADDGSMMPTLLGNIAIILLIILFIAAATLFANIASKKDTGTKPGSALTVKQLAFCSVSIALATVLQFVKFAELPFGGSITMFSMLAICLPGYFYGTGAGIMACVSFGLLKLLLHPSVYFPLQLVVDYILAFGSIGLCGLFYKSKHGMIKGYILGVFGRYFWAVLSGYIFFKEYATGDPILYTLSYNATYIVPEFLATLVILFIPPVYKALITVKRMANE